MKNIMAIALKQGQYQKKIVNSKKIYNRKKLKLTSKKPTAYKRLAISKQKWLFACKF